MFENVEGQMDGRRMDGRRSHWYTNSSPRSLRLTLAKNSVFIKKNCKNDTSTLYYTHNYTRIEFI